MTKQRTSKLIHPNSRQANQLTRLKHKEHQKHDKVKEKALKTDSKVNKFLWFQNKIDPNLDKYTNADLEKLVEE